jgi:hypothetical protein
MPMQAQDWAPKIAEVIEWCAHESKARDSCITVLTFGLRHAHAKLKLLKLVQFIQIRSLETRNLNLVI